MRCRSSVVGPLIAGALIIAAALILAALDTENAINSVWFAVIAGTYVAIMPGCGCRCGSKRAAAGSPGDLANPSGS